MLDMNHHMDPVHGITHQLLLTLPFVLGLVVYLWAVVQSRRLHKPWPLYCTIFFVLGGIGAIASVIGPLADQAHIDFRAHMITHLLLGMLAPLLMLLARPMTLILRTLPVRTARSLSRFLRSQPIRFLSNPIVTSLLNIGGLWLLYTTDLYGAMHQNVLLYLFVHIHLFLAGYFFTASMIYVEPIPHRFSFVFRAAVFVLALAGHSILSKYIYAHPPSGISINQAEMGGMLMYYGGDAIELVLIYILCFQWFKATRPAMNK